MLYYLDTNIIVYAIEGDPALHQRATSHLNGLETAGNRFAVSELTWTECLVFPLRNSDGPLLLEYYEFLQGSILTTISPTAAIHHRAAAIRGLHRFGLADSLHLAAAVEAGCERFLTNDQGLARFPDLTVEILP